MSPQEAQEALLLAIGALQRVASNLLDVDGKLAERKHADGPMVDLARKIVAEFPSLLDDIEKAS